MNRARRSPDRKFRENEAGFTLLELLVAMTILSLIALIMMGGLRLGVKVWERTEIATDSADAIDAAQSLIRRQLAAIYPQWQDSGPGVPQVLFEGNSQDLTFIGAPPQQFGASIYRQFEIQLSATRTLDLVWQTDSSPSSQVRSILLKGVASIHFEYFGPPAGGRVSSWSNTWSNRTRLPLLIRIHVVFPPNDRRVWPELTVHPEIAVDVKCIYDPISRACRGRPE